MSATSWFIIAIVGFSLTGIALVAAVFIFIKMRIPAVIGDLSGKTVAREIQAMRESNASSGTKIHKSSRVNMDRGKLTEKVEDEITDKSAMALAHSSKRLDKAYGTTSGPLSDKKKSMPSEEIIRTKTTTTEHLSDNVVGVSLATDSSEEKGERKTTSFTNEKATEELSKKHETNVFSDDATEVLSQIHEKEVLSNDATEVLSDYSEADKPGGTIVLSDAGDSDNADVSPVVFKITKDITEIHTDEDIKQ